MNKKLLTATAAFMTILSLMLGSCEKQQEPAPEQQEQTNFFTYEGYSFDINSVVRYEKGDNAVEIWLSPEKGLTETSAIQKAGDYVILNTNKEYLNKRDRFNAASSKGSFIKFADSDEFKYGDTGTAFIDVSVTDDIITISFMAQNLYTKAESTAKAAIQGTYKGSFATENELPYENEWGLGRERNHLAKAVYTTYENGSDSEFTLYTDDGKEAVKLTLAPALTGKQIYLPTAEDISLTYNGGVEYNLKNAAGSVSTSFSGENINMIIDLTAGDKRIRAYYEGLYEEDNVKENRYYYNYDGGESAYEGRHDIVKLMVENNGSECRLFFSPSDGYSINNANSTHMPILKVPSSIINAGKKSFMEIQNWEFAFDLMQVWPYNDEYKPHPAETDWIEINQDGNTYEVEFVLTSIATGMASSSMDLYFQGPASK